MTISSKIDILIQHAGLRMDACMYLSDWCKDKTEDELYRILERLLVHSEDSERYLSLMTEEQKYKCELLCGPNGYAVFKMLCIKMGLDDLVKTQNESKGSN